MRIMANVLVVGAGPTGLTAALELARLGLSVQIVERRAAPSPLSRAVGLQKRSIDILKPTGVADTILSEAIIFDAVAIHRSTRLVGRLPLNFDDRSRIWGLPQDRTEHHMIDGLTRAGISVRFGEAVAALRQDADGVIVTLPSGEERFDYVIGADGVHSTVRGAIGLPFDGYDLPDLWSIADVIAPDWQHPATFQGYFLPEGQVCVVVPLQTHRFRIIASKPDALAALPVPMDVTEVRRSGSFTIPVRHVPRFTVGRVFLAGDAAHCHSPVGGRGMNLGIADAADLASRIAGNRTDDYSAARLIESRQVIRRTETVRRMLQGPAWRRNIGFGAIRLAKSVPPLARVMMRSFVSG